MEVHLTRRVQFHETDAAGIVHFSWFFRYMEEAEYALWRAAGLSNAPVNGIGWPRVAAAFEYHSPLRFEDEFEVTLSIEAITKRTIRYSCAIRRGQAAIATGSLKVVCVRKREGLPFQRMEIPAAISERFTPATTRSGLPRDEV